MCVFVCACEVICHVFKKCVHNDSVVLSALFSNRGHSLSLFLCPASKHCMSQTRTVSQVSYLEAAPLIWSAPSGALLLWLTATGQWLGAVNQRAERDFHELINEQLWDF